MSDALNCWCVYIHTSPLGKKYVGITCQAPKDRWRNGNGYKHNSHFMRAIKKYGWDNFLHEIIADNLTERQAKDMEISLIERYNTTNQEFGYNISAGGDGTVGVQHFGADNPFYGKTHSEQTKIALSVNIKKTWENGALDALKRPVGQFNMEGDLIAEYESVKQAEEATGVGHSVICRVCSGKLNYTHGFTWAYKEDYIDLEKFKTTFLQKLAIKQSNFGKAQRKTVELYNLDGELVGVYPSASHLSREFGVHKDTVAYACRCGNIFQGAYKCKYAQKESELAS